MFIALTTNGASIDCEISQSFSLCSYLLIVNTRNFNCISIKSLDEKMSRHLATKIVEYDCEVLITGVLTSVEYDFFIERGIPVYIGSGHSGLKAIEYMENLNLKVINNENYSIFVKRMSGGS